jgi:hypothetical protein
MPEQLLAGITGWWQLYAAYSASSSPKFPGPVMVTLRLASPVSDHTQLPKLVTLGDTLPGLPVIAGPITGYRP